MRSDTQILPPIFLLASVVMRVIPSLLASAGKYFSYIRDIMISSIALVVE